MVFSHTTFYDTNVNVTYLLEGHWTFVRMLKLFLTARRLASTYWTKRQQRRHERTRNSPHMSNYSHFGLSFPIQKARAKCTWAKGVTIRSSPCLRTKKERNTKSCIIQNQNSDNHWVSSLVHALHVTSCQYNEQYLKIRLSLRFK